MSDDKADLFYGATTTMFPGVGKPPEQPPPPDQKEEPRDLFYREGAGAEHGPYSSSVKAGLQRLIEARGLSPEDSTRIRENAGTLFHDLKLDPQAAENSFNLYVRNVLETPDAKTVTAWSEESRGRLLSKYGHEGMTERLEAAQSFVEHHKGLGEILEQTGLGSHPDIVERLVELGWERRSQFRKDE